MRYNTDSLDQLIDAAKGYQAAEAELRYLASVHDWALLQQKVAAGDRARIRKSLVIPSDSGWWSWRECLAPGAVGSIGAVAYNQVHHYWYAEFVLDKEWSIGPNGTRYERASGRNSIFMLNVRHLKRIET